MSTHYALYHRQGWQSIRLVVLKIDQAGETVDLADESGALVVTDLPVVKDGAEPVSKSWATLEQEPKEPKAPKASKDTGKH